MKTQKFGIYTFAISVFLLIFMMSAGAPTSAQAQGQIVNTEDIFGQNGEIIGDSIEFETNEDGKLSRLIAKTESKPVELISDKLNATCNLLTYDVGADKLVAVGNPVNIKQEGIRATCANFTYYPKDGKAELTGNPIVYQKNDGREVGIKGNVIKIFQQEDGRQRVIVESGKTGKSDGSRSRLTMKEIQEAMGGKKAADQPAAGVQPANFEMTTKEPAKKEENKTSVPAVPVKLDASSRDKIPEPRIEE